MTTTSILCMLLGFVLGLLLSFFIRIRIAVGQDIEKLIQERALEIVQKALKTFDPITKKDEKQESDGEKTTD